MTLGPDDLWLFNEGAHTRLYDHLGAHLGTDAAGTAGCWFGVWAPNARAVSVVGDVNASPFVRSTTGSTFRVRMDGAMPYQLDGGDRKKTKKLKIKVKPKAITICVPEEANR